MRPFPLKRADPARFAICALAAACLVLTSCDRLKQLLPRQPPVQTAPLVEEEVRRAATAELFAPEQPVPESEVPVAEPFELNKSSIVSVMCYHDFADHPSRGDMVINAPVFRAQLQAVKDAGIPVVPLSDVLAWKRGEKNLPDEAVCITMDDGWIGVHQFAFPILREFGYPFTVYLYKNYVNRGGRSMTVAQIRELLANGAELGSHSVSHQQLTARHGRTEAEYREWLRVEIEDSKKFIEETFGVPCRTFAYPYGNRNEEIAQMVLAAGYEAGVTVNPQKITWDTPNASLGRFVALGDKDGNFKLATSFHGRSDVASSKFLKSDAVDEQGNPLFELHPAPNSTVAERRPLVRAGLKQLQGVIPESIVLRVSGFGAVPAEFDPATQIVRYQVPQKLRLEECTATLAFRRVGADKDEVVSWKFRVDQKAAYLPPGTPTAAQAPPTPAGPAPPPKSSS